MDARIREDHVAPSTNEVAIDTVEDRRGQALSHAVLQAVLDGNYELVVLYENFRDPLINDALRDACDRINRRGLRSDGRRLRFAVEPPPARRNQFG
jgi:hypothetical protein